MKKNPILPTLLATLLIALASIIWAHDKVKLTGYVVDVMCFAEQANGKPEEATKAAAEHTKDCGLKADCIKSGYGIYADGKWYPFDAKGNDLAKAVFEKTTKKDQIKMTVEGLKHDGKIQVQTLTEAQ
jgi:hypothetical protein